MNIKETLDWVTDNITYWYVKTLPSNEIEIIYPVTEDKIELLNKVFREDSNILIYKRNFYYTETYVNIDGNKVSYTFFTRRAREDKRKKAKAILPYSLNSKSEVVIRKLIKYYNDNNIPYKLISTNKDVIPLLNPLSYLDVYRKKIIMHRDVYYVKNNKLIALVTSDNKENLSKKLENIKDFETISIFNTK